MGKTAERHGEARQPAPFADDGMLWRMLYETARRAEEILVTPTDANHRTLELTWLT